MTQSFLDSSRALWDGHARRDPLWAILSDPAKRGGKWDLQRFFQTGVGEVALRLYEVRAHGIAIPRGPALDFGCGVGRLTQALAAHFDQVVGVDVSPEMVALASRLNRWPGKVSYVVNTAPDLAIFSDGHFAAILSHIVLQHVEPGLSLGYVREFLRVLEPGGVLIFQLPSHERPKGDATPSVAAMPDEAYVVQLGVRGVPAGPVAPGSTIVLEIEVTNRSGVDWSRDPFGVIRAGNHWLDASGQMLLRDDGRTALPGWLPSGQTVVVPLAVTVPAGDGRWLCEIDLAHEGVTWFADRGSLTARFPVMVRADACPAGAVTEYDQRVFGEYVRTEARRSAGGEADLPAVGNPSAEDPVDFPMFGVPTDEVRAVIAQGHGEPFLVEDDRSCGDAWVSYRYFVRRRP